jgi:hypothetical protein
MLAQGGQRRRRRWLAGWLAAVRRNLLPQCPIREHERPASALLAILKACQRRCGRRAVSSRDFFLKHTRGGRAVSQKPHIGCLWNLDTEPAGLGQGGVSDLITMGLPNCYSGLEWEMTMWIVKGWGMVADVGFRE